MKKSIKIEKSILRYRLVLIRNWALKQLKEMRSKALKMYQKIEDWILVAVKSENDASEEMVTFFCFLLNLFIVYCNQESN